MVRAALPLLLLLLLFLAGCSGVTEHEMLYDAELRVFSGSGLDPLATLETDQDSRCILVRNKRIYIGGTDGFVRCYHEDSHNLLEEVQVGQPSTAGYIDMEYSPVEESIYMTGALGVILELSPVDCSIIDMFSVSPFPGMLEMSPGQPGFLWVVDSSLNQVIQVHPVSNGICNILNVPSYCLISSLGSCAREDSLLLGTTEGYFRLEVNVAGGLRSTVVKDFPYACCAISPNPADSGFVTVLRMYQNTMAGEMHVFHDSLGVEPPAYFTHAVEIQGSIFMMETGMQDEVVYILSSHGAGESLLSVYRPGEEYGLEAQVEIPGNPLDLSVSEGGEVYVLSYR